MGVFQKVLNSERRKKEAKKEVDIFSICPICETKMIGEITGDRAGGYQCGTCDYKIMF